MPDPSDPTPVSVVKRGDRWAVVASDGRTLETVDSEDAAHTVADQINASWKRAKGERRAKGAPAVTETREERIAAREQVFNEILAEAWSDVARRAALLARRRKGHHVPDMPPTSTLGRGEPHAIKADDVVELLDQDGNPARVHGHVLGISPDGEARVLFVEGQRARQVVRKVHVSRLRTKYRRGPGNLVAPES